MTSDRPGAHQKSRKCDFPTKYAPHPRHIKYILLLCTVKTAPLSTQFLGVRLTRGSWFLPQATVLFLYFTSIPLLHSQGHSFPHGPRPALYILHGRCLWFLITSNTSTRLLEPPMTEANLKSNSLFFLCLNLFLLVRFFVSFCFCQREDRPSPDY